jgi:hypothetical protein
MHDARYCYFHTKQIISGYFGARARRRRYQTRFELPLLNDRAAILDMLNQVAQALCHDTIDYKRAAAMISALRLATTELDRSQRS